MSSQKKEILFERCMSSTERTFSAECPEIPVHLRAEIYAFARQCVGTLAGEADWDIAWAVGHHAGICAGSMRFALRWLKSKEDSALADGMRIVSEKAYETLQEQLTAAETLLKDALENATPGTELHNKLTEYFHDLTS